MALWAMRHWLRELEVVYEMMEEVKSWCKASLKWLMWKAVLAILYFSDERLWIFLWRSSHNKWYDLNQTVDSY